MEGDDFSRRQYEQSSHTSGRGYRHNARGRPENISSDRLQATQQRQHLSSMRSPISVPRMGLAAGPTASSNQGLANYAAAPYAQAQQHSHYSNPLQQTPIQYQADFSQEPQRQSQQQPTQTQFSQYPPSMLYNMQPSAQTQPAYESMQQYQPRQTASIEVLSNQFGSPQYYSAGEQSTIAGTTAVPQSYTGTGQFQQFPDTLSSGRISLPSSYPHGLTDYPAVQPSANAPLSEPTIEQDTAANAANPDAAYQQYLATLSRTFQYVLESRLSDAAQSLLQISEWLLGSAVDLGLANDSPDLHDERMKMWHNFNICWLAVLQRQKDMTQEVIDTGQSLQAMTAARSLLSWKELEKMAEDMIRLADPLERHGLVDYQMGVWEEEIMSVLKDCLDLIDTVLDAEPDDTGPSSTGAPNTTIR